MLVAVLPPTFIPSCCLELEIGSGLAGGTYWQGVARLRSLPRHLLAQGQARAHAGTEIYMGSTPSTSLPGPFVVFQFALVPVHLEPPSVMQTTAHTCSPMASVGQGWGVAEVVFFPGHACSGPSLGRCAQTTKT
uniref:Uncharacterized protein n=1 Tax=Eutreptiella gymnastica TaxID=73025 RepID=A0A7S4G015_9EUGL|mmetsp:Transcript_32424/g.54391  ORF Transcript_32424/g.54391 Transcript_32424/m.54391 type:complete len:134 (+) Transcript_32424:41-442(+)